jgi:DegV family protein with EDD domain
MASDSAVIRSFAVVTDSTADISPEIAAEHGIEVVRLAVSFGTETITDGDLTQAEFFERMAAAPKLPTTSQPAVGTVAEVYERVLRTADEIISVHISEKLSGTISSARQAAEMFGGRVHVFDSRNLSWGLAWQVIEAANAAREGLSVAAALERLDGVRDRVKLIVGLDSLDNLSKGGRIGKVSAFLGSMLDLKVTLTVGEDGAFMPVARSRGEKAAIAHTLAWVGEKMGDAKRGSFAVGHALSEARAQRLRQEIEARWEATRMVVYEAGSVICTHTGTGWGVAVLPEG